MTVTLEVWGNKSMADHWSFFIFKDR